jgi:hypothetical protein
MLQFLLWIEAMMFSLSLTVGNMEFPKSVPPNSLFREAVGLLFSLSLDHIIR